MNPNEPLRFDRKNCPYDVRSSMTFLHHRVAPSTFNIRTAATTTTTTTTILKTGQRRFLLFGLQNCSHYAVRDKPVVKVGR